VPGAGPRTQRTEASHTLFDVEGWPLVLLGLRIAAVALLYLFLFSAFWALRGELSATRTPSAEPLPTAPPRPDPEPYREPAPGPARPPRRSPARVAMASASVALVIVLAGGALFAIGDALRSRGDPPEVPTDQAAASVAPFGPPAVTPVSGQVTVGLAATTDAQLRVTVDGTVQFQGTLAAGQRQAWDGRQRIQVWTDSGRTLLLAVNGRNLGPYSHAMGHPDWNRIDFGFWPGWTQ
jgi:hypothetical protein